MKPLKELIQLTSSKKESKTVSTLYSKHVTTIDVKNLSYKNHVQANIAILTDVFF